MCQVSELRCTDCIGASCAAMFSSCPLVRLCFCCWSGTIVNADLVTTYAHEGNAALQLGHVYTVIVHPSVHDPESAQEYDGTVLAIDREMDVIWLLCSKKDTHERADFLKFVTVLRSYQPTPGSSYKLVGGTHVRKIEGSQVVCKPVSTDAGERVRFTTCGVIKGVYPSSLKHEFHWMASGKSR